MSDLMENTKGITRRNFLAGISTFGVAAGLGTLSACAPKPQTGTAYASAGSGENQPWVPEAVDATYDTDLLIVGCGGSGIACAVQSAQNGTDFIVIEKSNMVGGNANFVEGIFAIDSAPQKEAGIEIKPVDVIMSELERGQYRINGALWMDLCEKSAGNIDWLLEMGCLFSGVIDDYHGGLFKSFHWWKDGKASAGYVQPMKKKMDELGIEPHLKTSAISLMLDGEKVVGVYAEGPEGIIQYNAKAVVLATGGFGGSPEMLGKQGWDTDALHVVGSPNAAGDAYNMCMEIGARDFLPYASQSILGFIEALPIVSMEDPANPINGYWGIASGGPVLWVNEYADRFNDESLRDISMVMPFHAMKDNKANYCVFDQSIFEKYFGLTDADVDVFNNALEENAGESLYKAETIEELATKFNLDSEALKTTVNRYNEICEKGLDTDFGKTSECLEPIKQAPFYIAKIGFSSFFTTGGIWTNKRREVLNEDKQTIPGLYAIGNDGSMLYRNVYTINMPGTAFGNQVNSGREAANYASEYINS
jgi:fumarate reductase flavoprotein subunit